MKNQEAVKLLSVNGVSPSTQSIRSSTYPLTVDVYMVTSNQSRPSTQKLMDWILSKQGQQLIEDTGYVPVR
jgi:phosphate transport system substrate-binding protein